MTSQARFGCVATKTHLLLINCSAPKKPTAAKIAKKSRPPRVYIISSAKIARNVNGCQNVRLCQINCTRNRHLSMVCLISRNSPRTVVCVRTKIKLKSICTVRKQCIPFFIFRITRKEIIASSESSIDPYTVNQAYDVRCTQNLFNFLIKITYRAQKNSNHQSVSNKPPDFCWSYFKLHVFILLFVHIMSKTIENISSSTSVCFARRQQEEK